MIDRPEKIHGKWVRVITDAEASKRCLKNYPIANCILPGGRCAAIIATDGEHPPITAIAIGNCPLEVKE